MPERSLILGEAAVQDKTVPAGTERAGSNEDRADISSDGEENPASEEAGYNSLGIALRLLRPETSDLRYSDRSIRALSLGLQDDSREPRELTYCPVPAPERRLDAAGAASDCLAGSTNNCPVAEVPGISVSLAGWPDLASAMVML